MAMDMMNPNAEEEGEAGLCIEIYVKPDGTYTVSAERKPASDDGQPAATLDEALQLARDMAENPPAAEEEEEGEMAAMQSGYAKRAMKPMGAPNPGGVFGE